MSDYVAHFTIEENGEEITRRGRLILYDDPDGKFQVQIDGQQKTFDMECLNTIKHQKWKDDSQQELL